MFRLAADVQVYLHREAIDFRIGINGLAILVEQAMQQGYVGFSSDGLPLHYLANDPHRNEKLYSAIKARLEL